MATKPNNLFWDQLKVPMGQISVEKDDPDAALIKVWNERQRLLADIESVGRFYDGDTTAPAKMTAFDLLETSIPKIQAMTARGLLAKLWVALGHRGPYVSTDEQRAESDAIRRADFDEVEAFADRLDFDQGVIFAAIRDVRYWLQFEQVGYLPQRKLEQ